MLVLKEQSMPFSPLRWIVRLAATCLIRPWIIFPEIEFLVVEVVEMAECVHFWSDEEDDVVCAGEVGDCEIVVLHELRVGG